MIRAFVRSAGSVLALAAFLAGCTEPLKLQAFDGDTPHFYPMRFFAGHVVSTGVVESSDGLPTEKVETDIRGRREGDVLVINQTIRFSRTGSQTRRWRLRAVGPDAYEAAISDGVGPARGEVHGNLLHLRSVIALKPGNPLFNVRFDQWMRMSPDGSMVNRTRVLKAGTVVAFVTEHFRRVGGRSR